MNICGQDEDEKPNSRSPILSVQLGRPGLVTLLLVGSALLVTNCQSGNHLNPPPRPAALPVERPKAINPAQWRLEANRWLGVNYRKGGMDRTGIDCSGLTSAIYLSVARTSLPRISQDQFRCGIPVRADDLRPGDLVFFVSLGQRVIDHVGIYLGESQFVHASASKGVVVSSLRQEYYARRFYGAKRIML